jgi:hypothetical protein
MITYNWNCKTVDIYPESKGQANVVYYVHWTLTGEEDDYFASYLGLQQIEVNPSETFIPFEDLTNEIITGWVKNAMGPEKVTEAENEVALKISEQKNPTSITTQIV